MMPIEIYIAILVACACAAVLMLSFLVAAAYFKVRVDAVERQLVRLDGELTGLIHETQEFTHKMNQLATRGNTVMQDIGLMTQTVRGWTDRADQVVGGVTRATSPTMQFVSNKLGYGERLIRGLIHVVLSPDRKRSLTRSLDMSECSTGSATPRMMLAFGAGALAGVAMALLFAPQSGKQTRDQVASKAHDLKDTADDVIERGKHIVQEVKHEAHEVFEKGKKIAREAAAA